MDDDDKSFWDGIERGRPVGFGPPEGLDLSGVSKAKLDEYYRAELAGDAPWLVKDWSPPIMLPPLWVLRERSDTTGMYDAPTLKLRAMLSCTRHEDQREWLHLSVSHKDRIPKWSEVKLAKGIFLGDREGYIVLPPQARYVNINSYVLHVFALRDPKQAALPDFTRGTGSL